MATPLNFSHHWPAPAKFNRFLHITGRRPDGYHDLQTVFQFLDYCDELQFAVRDDSEIILEDFSTTILPEENLIVRAARALQRSARCSLGATIRLHKRIPLGAGLGGGSSNAATTLMALNHLWNLHLPLSTLMPLGQTLGADVPIFIYGHAAWAEGIGEKLTPLVLEEPWVVVIVPPCQVSTAEIFSHPELTRDTPPITIERFLQGPTENDVEKLVGKLYPPIANALNWLAQHGPARLTGTGCCVFSMAQDQQQARRIVKQIPPEFFGFAAKALNNSPLHKYF